jgi:hypothetical protein
VSQLRTLRISCTPTLRARTRIRTRDRTRAQAHAEMNTVYPNGEVCISILHAPGDDPLRYESASERWSPVQGVRSVLLSVLSMLAEPNVESGADIEVSFPGYTFTCALFRLDVAACLRSLDSGLWPLPVMGDRDRCTGDYARRNTSQRAALHDLAAQRQHMSQGKAYRLVLQAVPRQSTRVRTAGQRTGRQAARALTWPACVSGRLGHIGI